MYIPVVFFFYLFSLSWAHKTYHYGVTGDAKHEPTSRLSRYQSTSVSLSPLEDNLRVQQILKKLEDPGGIEIRRKSTTRRLHGVPNTPIGKILSGSGGGLRKKSYSRKMKERTEVNQFEQELARQIEEDQLKFVEDEKNPMKYVVENGLLFKKSRYSPLARVEIPPISKNPNLKNSTKKKRKRGKALNPVFRTNVFRGNINRQIPAIPLPSPFSAAYGKPSFAIAREEDGSCYTNRFGYRCCDENLESLILKSFEKLRRKNLDIESNLARISSTLRRDSRQVFAKNFEAIVSTANFGSSIPSDFSCKVELGPQKLIAQVFVPDLDIFDSPRRHRLPYHELSREDLNESADLVVSRNGIIVSQVL